MKFQIDKILTCAVKDANGITLSEWTKNPCPLLDFCNYRSAICRVREPDETCYWYRYFENLIKENNKEA